MTLQRKTPLKRTPMKRRSRPKMTPIRASAKGEQCLARIPGVCNCPPETVVLAHHNGAGMGMKHPDLFGCYAGAACHAWLDGGYVRHGTTREQRDLYHLQAVMRTQERLLEKGLIIIQGEGKQ